MVDWRRPIYVVLFNQKNKKNDNLLILFNTLGKLRYNNLQKSINFGPHHRIFGKFKK